MPKKKTGQRKKAEKMKLRQKEIAGRKDHMAIVEKPCNFTMECDKCQRSQVRDTEHGIEFIFKFTEEPRLPLLLPGCSETAGLR